MTHSNIFVLILLIPSLDGNIIFCFIQSVSASSPRCRCRCCCCWWCCCCWCCSGLCRCFTHERVQEVLDLGLLGGGTLRDEEAGDLLEELVRGRLDSLAAEGVWRHVGDVAEVRQRVGVVQLLDEVGDVAGFGGHCRLLLGVAAGEGDAQDVGGDVQDGEESQPDYDWHNEVIVGEGVAQIHVGIYPKGIPGLEVCLSPKSLAFMKRPLVWVVDCVRGGRRHSDGGRAHNTAPKPHPEDNLSLKESCGDPC